MYGKLAAISCALYTNIQQSSSLLCHHLSKLPQAKMFRPRYVSGSHGMLYEIYNNTVLQSVTAIISVVVVCVIFVVIKTRNNQSSNLFKTTRVNENDNIQSTDNSNRHANDTNDEASETYIKNINNWKCACEGGGIFLPQSLMRSLGGPTAAIKLGAGSCYHKQR